MSRPLVGVRVLDLTRRWRQGCGRILADLGADVVLAARAADGDHEPHLAVALRNAGKRRLTLDPTSVEDQARLGDLLAGADILVDDGSWPSIAPEHLIERHPALVVLSVSDFGRTGPYRAWAGSEDVLTALGGVLSRSGLPGEPPLLPPRGLVHGTACVHAAWAALVAYTKRLRTGVGELADVSALEAVVHGFDPGFGAQGTAAAGRAETFPRGRPDARNFYPVFGCADGQVRICLLAKRQWRAMFAWLGEPAEFADPAYDAIPARFAAADRLHPLIAALFAPGTRAALVAEGTRRGVPIAGVLTLDEVRVADHFTATGALVDAELAPGVVATVPAGYLSVDGVRLGLPPVLACSADAREVTWAPRALGLAGPAFPVASAPAGAVRRPLEGLRVLDLGVIVFGAELGRLLADQGAEVIKLESTEFPDGLRQSRRGSGISASFAWGHRNKQSLGLNLRDPRGAELFRGLVRQADVVLSNFKPGTLAALGFPPEELARLNPLLVTSDSGAFGGAGPWSARLGYGPLVRASCGVTELWRDAGEHGGPCDGSTVYPDHVAAHVTAVGVLAALVGRAGTGRGPHVSTAQADVALTQLAGLVTAGDEAPAELSCVCPCAGDDDWCVVTVRDDADWHQLASLLPSDVATDPRLADDAGRAAHPAAVTAALAGWTSGLPCRLVMERLQQLGVPAGAMLRLPELLADPQLVERRTFTRLAHPDLPTPQPASARCAAFSTIPDADQRPAPALGEHTREIVHSLLGLDDTGIDELVAAGVLYTDAPASEREVTRAAPAVVS